MVVATYNTISILLQTAAPADDLALASIKAFLISLTFVAFISALKLVCRYTVAVLWAIVTVLSTLLYLLQLLQSFLEICFSKDHLWRFFYGIFAFSLYCILVDIGPL
jgi:heme/copper-type cytochrome/quinol oxidase subunit 4